METEVNIQDLLDKIKREGVEEAEKTAQSILEKARLEAEVIVKDAKEEAARMLTRASEEVAKQRVAFGEELAQAGRDLILSLQQEIIRMVSGILEREVRSALKPDLLKELLLKIVDRWRNDEEFQGIEVLLSVGDRVALEDGIFKALREELQDGVVLKPVAAIEAGIRIGERGGEFHFDFTDKGIAELLSEYLNPRVAMFLKGAAANVQEKA